ncbi:MAG: hypothetical protein ACI4XA_08695 [Oscillospiraceae bacterium]
MCMGIVIISGECAADRLFGTVFPKAGTVFVGDGAVIRAPESVVILGRGGTARVESALGVVVSGDYPLPVLPADIQLITCGSGAKNTVSFSSSTDTELTLSLNRSMHTAAGICDPLELPVHREPACGEYSHMAAFAAAVLLGAIPF